MKKFYNLKAKSLPPYLIWALKWFYNLKAKSSSRILYFINTVLSEAMS